MEREPSPARPAQSPASPEAPQQPERSGFFEKLRKKAKRPPEAEQRKLEAQETTPTPEAPRPERRKFGRNILGLLFGEKREPAQEQQSTAPEQPVRSEAEPLAPTPESTPQYERATRMRRLARVIIARVLGEAAEEPTRAREHHEQPPIDTEPLVEAAHELRDATDDLTDTIREAREASVEPATTYEAPRSDSDYDSIEPRPQAPQIEQTPSERIDDRLRQLEQSAEASKTATLAAVGLGVIAVLVTGTEYFSRKRHEREIRRDMKKQFKQQERAVKQQQGDFNRLRESFTADMNRNQRKDYYERLSDFTYQQAQRTREANRELQEVVTQTAPTTSQVAAPAERTIQPERPAWQPRQAESVQQPAQTERQPLLRVETADVVERVPGQQTGNAGTGFFGGGGGGIASGTGPSDLNPPKIIDPNSREARQLEALRKAEQARLQQNAWLYSAALVLAMIALVIVTVVLG